MIAIDFKKAFDSIDHGWLQNVLRQKRLPVIFINYIDSIQRKGFSFIKTNHGLTTKFPIQKGVRQGDPLSLTLFIIALNPLINAMQKNNNIASPNPTKNAPKAIAYADNLTLTISKRISIQYMKEILNKYHNTSGLQINEKKTAGLAINKLTSETHLWDISWKTQKIEPLNITVGPPPNSNKNLGYNN